MDQRQDANTAHRHRPFACGLLSAFLLLSNVSPASQDIDNYLDLPLNELLNIEITSVAKKPQSLSSAAAAIYVISADDIRRSTATSIPDLLRMVPGLQVAQINQHQWSVSARGFAGLWSNKLLVLMDGRTLYTPFFGGVYWDTQETLLSNIERIEVIRGPGGTLWGANAVNGVINIITKQAADTQGSQLIGRYGNEEKGTLGLRHGGRFGDAGHYRLYAKTQRRDDSRQQDGDTAHDGSRLAQVGFRIDNANGSDQWTLQGDLYDGENRTLTPVTSFSFPYSRQVDDTEQLSGGNLMLHWQHRFAPASISSLQIYYDHTSRDSLLLEDRLDTFDVDFHHRFRPGRNHELIWGAGYRFIRDRTEGSVAASVDPADRDDQIFSAFVQDEIQLQPEKLALILGGKVEYNDYTGTEWQPNARMVWTPSTDLSLWGAVSRAIRTPSRFESDSLLQSVLAPIPPTPVVLGVSGNDNLRAEDLTAFELGLRRQLRPTLAVDLALFYHRYRDVLGLMSPTTSCQPSGTALPPCPPGDTHYLIATAFDSDVDGSSHGLELSFDWQAAAKWRVKGSYSYLSLQLDSRIDAALDELAEALSPKHQLSLRSSWDLAHETELDLWLYYVDELPGADIPSYVSIDGRIAWRPRRDVELSLVGRHLLDDHHPEYYDLQSGGLPRNEVGRSVYAQLRLDY